MKNMDKFWQGAELIFQKQLDNKKTVIGGYAISFICVAISILLVSIMLWRHNEFSAETIETAVASPKARPIPKMIPEKIPDFAANKSTLKYVWVFDTPKANEPNS